MPSSIQRGIQKAQQLQAEGKLAPAAPAPQNANIPPASDGTGINGPARGGYLPGQVFDSDVMATGPMGGSAPMRSRVFPFVPQESGSTVAQQLAAAAAALASETTEVSLPLDKIVTASGPGGSLQSGGPVITIPVAKPIGSPTGRTPLPLPPGSIGPPTPTPPTPLVPVVVDQVNDGPVYRKVIGVAPNLQQISKASILGDTSGDTTTDIMNAGTGTMQHTVMSTQTQTVVTTASEINDTVSIVGRTEQIGTTVGKLNSSGLLLTADDVAADGATFGRVNTTALTSNNVDLANSGVVNKVLSNINDDANYVRTPQVSGQAIVVPNPNFVNGTAGWQSSGPVILGHSASSPFSNGWSLQFEATSSAGPPLVSSTTQFKVSPGDTLYFSAYSVTDGVFNLSLGVWIYDGAGNLLSNSILITNTSGSWINQSASGVAPANSAYAVIIGERFDATGGTHNAWITDIQLTRAANLDNEVVNGLSNFTRTAGHSSYFPTSNPLTAADAGSNATINIASFTMQVGGTAVSNNSGSITALSYSTLYYVYYSDPTLSGGAITYHATTTKSTAVAGNGQLFVGSILTPAATAPNTSGNGDGGTGAQYGAMYQMLFNTATPTVSGGTVTNPSNAIDGSFISSATIAPAASGGSSASLLVSGMPGIRTGRTQTITLNVLSSVTSASGPITCEIQYSLNGGASFSVLYSVTTNRALTADSVSLVVSQNPGLVQVKASLISTGTAAGHLNLYESWISIQE